MDVGIPKEPALNNLEIDTIGEILNISMGAAATAVSDMLSKTVRITTPVVSFIKAEDFECSSLEPAIGIGIEYIEGLSGSNIMVMRQRDLRIIVGLLLGEQSDPDSVEELDEMHISAASEIMNQMMGASSTALATFFGQSVNISPPKQFDVAAVKDKILKPDGDGHIVTVKFMLAIEEVLDSEFVTIMPVEFTKKLVDSAMHVGDPVKEKTPAMPAPEEALPKTQAVSASFAPAASYPAAPEAPEPRAAPLPQQRVARQSTVDVQPLTLPSFDSEQRPSSRADASGNFGLIMGVPLEVSVEIGKTRLSVREILDIRQGSLIELDKQAGDPVDVIINGQLIARGDVVIIDDDFGVRITEILSERAAIGE